MLSGRKLLGIIDSQLGEARQRVDGLNRVSRQAAEHLARNRALQAEALRRLAGSRLDAVREGRIGERLDRLEQQARTILAERELAVSELDRRIRTAEKRLEALETRRNEAHEAVDGATRTLAEREAAAQRSLEGDPAFRAQLEATESAQAIAVSAAEKAATAEDDRQAKGKPYQDDEFFMYLWKRHYGTSEYRANPLARLLDGWVARLCGYEDARRNYWMLLEIPRRLAEHAEQAQEAAEAEAAELAQLEEAAAREAGVMDAEATLEEAQARQDELDEQIARTEDELNELLAQQGEFAAGTDEYLSRALSVFTEELDRQDINVLMRAAMATLTPDDDAIVADLRELRSDAAELEQEVRQNQAAESEYLRRVRELGDVRRKFKLSRYDDLRSGFENGSTITRMLGELMAGAISVGGFWDILRRNQRYRNVAGERPNFGSGGIVFPRSRIPRGVPRWEWPGPASRGGGGFRVPRMPRGGSPGGGFRTGGGF